MNTQFPSLPNPPDLAAVFGKFPHGARPLLEFHDIILRGDSPLTPGERELIAAHVSGLNACKYCYGAHTTIARAFGIDFELIEAMQTDLDNANLAENLKPIIAYVSKLTITPARMTPADARAVYDAGWNERALYDAISVCALFNLMNRIVEGTGCSARPGISKEGSDKPLASYLSWGREAGFID